MTSFPILWQILLALPSKYTHSHGGHHGPSHSHVCLDDRLDTFCCKSNPLSHLSTGVCSGALGVSCCHLPAPSLPKGNKTKSAMAEPLSKPRNPIPPGIQPKSLEVILDIVSSLLANLGSSTFKIHPLPLLSLWSKPPPSCLDCRLVRCMLMLDGNGGC